MICLSDSNLFFIFLSGCWFSTLIIKSYRLPKWCSYREMLDSTTDSVVSLRAAIKLTCRTVLTLLVSVLLFIRYRRKSIDSNLAQT